MKDVSAVAAPNFSRTVLNYINVLKPRETVLLTFIGVCSSIVATAGSPAADKFVIAFIAILLGSGGANGLTNYLDRDLDARMQRTCRRSLPAQKVSPPEKILPLALGIVIVGLGLAWWLHPICFAVGLIGTLTAVTWRKKVSCAFPQGTIAGCSPVLIGWLAFRPEFSIELLFICFLIALWIPLHIWSIMIFSREDYLSAGIGYFPISWDVGDAIKVLLGLSWLICAASIGLYFTAGFGVLYLITALVLGTVLIGATVRLWMAGDSNDAWRVYKLSSFPYLGIIFLAMCIDVWV